MGFMLNVHVILLQGVMRSVPGVLREGEGYKEQVGTRARGTFPEKGGVDSTAKLPTTGVLEW